MKSEPRGLDRVRAEAVPLMSASVREIEFAPREEHGSVVWSFEGQNSGITCEIESLPDFWGVSLEPVGIVIELAPDLPGLRSFLTSFDVEPMFVVEAWIWMYNLGWRLRFANEKVFYDRSRLERFFARRSSYREFVYEVRVGAPLPPLQ